MNLGPVGEHDVVGGPDEVQHLWLSFVVVERAGEQHARQTEFGADSRDTKELVGQDDSALGSCAEEVAQPRSGLDALVDGVVDAQIDARDVVRPQVVEAGSGARELNGVFAHAFPQFGDDQPGPRGMRITVTPADIDDRGHGRSFRQLASETVATYRK